MMRYAGHGRRPPQPASVQCAAPPFLLSLLGSWPAPSTGLFPSGPHIERACWQYEDVAALFFKVQWMPSDRYPVTGRRNCADLWQFCEKFSSKKALPSGKALSPIGRRPDSPAYPPGLPVLGLPSFRMYLPGQAVFQLSWNPGPLWPFPPP